MAFNPDNREPGFYVEKSNIYISFISHENVKLKALPNMVPNMDIFIALYHYEEVGVLFVLHSKFKVMDQNTNYLVIDESCGEGNVYWSDMASVHSSVSHTIFVANNANLDMEK